MLDRQDIASFDILSTMSPSRSHPFRCAGWILGSIAASLGAGILAPSNFLSTPWNLLAVILAGLVALPALFSLIEISSQGPLPNSQALSGSYLGLAGGLATWCALVQFAAWNLQVAGAIFHSLFFPLINLPPILFSIAMLLMLGLWQLGLRKRLNTTSFIALLGTPLLLSVFWKDSPTQSNFLTFAEPWQPGLWIGAFAGMACLSARSRKSDFLSTPLLIFAWGTVLILALISATFPPSSSSQLRIWSHWTNLFDTRIAFIVGCLQIIILLIAAAACLRSAAFQTAALGNDRLLPEDFANPPRPGIPHRITALAMAAVLPSLALTGILSPERLSAAFLLITMALLNLTVLVLRESGADRKTSKFRMPFFPWLPAVGIISSTVLLAGLGISAWIAACLPLLGALAVFHNFVRARLLRMAWLHDEGLDWELREILKEKGLHPTDPFDELVSRSLVLEKNGLPLSQLCLIAAEEMSAKTGLNSEEARDQFVRSINSGFFPLERGVALPHLRSNKLQEPQLLMIRSATGIAPDGMEEPLLKAFFFLITPKDKPSVHLHTLARIAARLQRPHFLEDWLSAGDAESVRALMLRHERSLSIFISPDGNSSQLIGKNLRELNLPDNCLIALLRRGDALLIPRGSTVVQEGDRLTFIGDPTAIRQIYRTLS